MSSLRSSSLQPRMADLISWSSSHKDIFRPPEESPATTNGWHLIIRRARYHFQVRRSPVLWGPRIYSQAHAPGLNGVSMKLYKNAQLSWNSSSVSYREPGGKGTSHKNGVWLMRPGYRRRRTLLKWAPSAHFRSLNMEGKIFFGIIARRMTPFLHQDKHINTSCQRAGIPRLVAFNMLKWSGIR